MTVTRWCHRPETEQKAEAGPTGTSVTSPGRAPLKARPLQFWPMPGRPRHCWGQATRSGADRGAARQDRAGAAGGPPQGPQSGAQRPLSQAVILTCGALQRLRPVLGPPRSPAHSSAFSPTHLHTHPHLSRSSTRVVAPATAPSPLEGGLWTTAGLQASPEPQAPGGGPRSPGTAPLGRGLCKRSRWSKLPRSSPPRDAQRQPQPTGQRNRADALKDPSRTWKGCGTEGWAP